MENLDPYVTIANYAVFGPSTDEVDQINLGDLSVGPDVYKQIEYNISRAKEVKSKGLSTNFYPTYSEVVGHVIDGNGSFVMSIGRSHLNGGKPFVFIRVLVVDGCVTEVLPYATG